VVLYVYLESKISVPRISSDQVSLGLSSRSAIVDTHDMITQNFGKHRRSWRGSIGKYLLAAYLLAAGILILTGLNIMILLGVLALFAGIAILMGV
jgi:hypothetical protein